MTSSTSYSLADDHMIDPLNPKDADYLYQWCDDATVAEAISKGLRLREQKPQVNQKNKRGKSLRVTGGSDKRNKRRIRRPKSARIARTVRSSSPASTMTAFSQPWIGKKQYRRESMRKLKCPVRVALLAVPSKRHCLETWRNKYHTLPDVMVERLKKHVMDENPQVTVEDAVTCFKTVKSRPVVKRPVMTSNPRVYRRKLFANYCDTFANRIGRKMMASQKFILNPHLECLSKVISHDLKGLLKRVYKKDGCEYLTKKIHKEMSNKIAVWIARIMEDTNEKLIEEDLREQRIVERKTEKRSMTVTMIQQQRCECSDAISELEEEEGPALDAVDDLIHGVMKICIPHIDTYSSDDEPPRFEFPPYEEESSVSSKLNQWFTTSDLDSDPHATSLYGKTDADGSVGSTTHTDLPSTDHHVNTLNEDNTVDQNETDDDLSDDVEDAKSEYHESEQNDIANEVTQSNTEGADDTNTLYVGNVVKGNRDEIKTIFNAIIDKSGANVSEVFVVVNDKLNKSNIITLRNDNSKPEQRIASDNNNTHSRTPSVIFKHESELKPSRSVAFGPPNNYLLNEADEIWPKPLIKSDTKLTGIVSKSVTSLGNILEIDEKNYTTKETKNHGNDKEDELTVTLIDFEHKSNPDMVKIQEMEAEIQKIETLQWVAYAIVEKLLPSGVDVPFELDGISGTSSPSEISMSSTIDLSDAKDELYQIHKPTGIDASTSHHRMSEPDGFETKPVGVEQGTTPSAVLLDMCVGTTTEKIDKQTDPKEDHGVSDESDVSSIVEQQRHKNSAVKGKEKSNSHKDKPTPPHIIRDRLRNIGMGDHNDADHEDNAIIEIAQAKVEQNKKFDYRVDPATAPSWTLSPPSDDSLQSIAKKKFKQTTGQSDIRKWCNTLDHAFANLEQCNNWMELTCRKILALKEGNECKCKPAGRWEAKIFEGRKINKLKKEIDKEAIFWTKLNYRYREQLKMYSRNKNNKIKLDATFSNEINPVRTTGGNWLEALDEVDRLILWTHRMIVSAEYCVKCNCKKM